MARRYASASDPFGVFVLASASLPGGESGGAVDVANGHF